MAGKWQTYWRNLSSQIQQGLTQYRQSGRALIPLSGLRNISTRLDLYSCVTVSVHGPSSNVAGKQHMLDLSRVIAPLLSPEEPIRACIINRNNQDYLEFSKP